MYRDLKICFHFIALFLAIFVFLACKKNKDKSSDAPICLENCESAPVASDSNQVIPDPLLSSEFENGSLASSFGLVRNSSATYFDENGVLQTASSNEIRVEYNKQGEKLGILIEEGSSNLFLYSEELDNAAWTTFGTVVANTSAGLDGSTTADRIHTVTDTAGILRQRVDTGAALGGRVFTASVWVKGTIASDKYTQMMIVPSFSGNWPSTMVRGDDIRGTYSEWTRISTTGVIRSFEVDTSIDVIFGVENGSADFAGTDFEVWGFQLEEYGDASSYIPTTTSSVGRDSDYFSMTNMDWFNQGSSTISIEVVQKYNDISAGPLLSIVSGSTETELIFEKDSSLSLNLVQSSTTTSSLSLPKSDSVRAVALSSDGSVMRLAQQGLVGQEASVSSWPTTPTELRIGRDASGRVGNLYLKSVTVWPEVLTVNQLSIATYQGSDEALALSTESVSVALFGEPVNVLDYLSGGVAPFNFSLTSGQSGSLEDGLFTPKSSGNSVIEVTDANGAKVALSINVDSPNLSVDFTSGSLPSGFTFSRSSSATYFDANGTLQIASNDVPRFTFDPVTGENLGVILEKESENLLENSEDFSASWSPSGASVSTNVASAPDGNTTADALVENTSTSVHELSFSQSVTGETNSQMVFTVFAKASGRDKIQLEMKGDGSTYIQAVYDLSQGVVSDRVDSNYFDLYADMFEIGNGWYRCLIHGDGNGHAAAQLSIRLHDGTSTSYTGDGSSGVLLWGAQFEYTEFPTSYIPTSGSSVIRQADRLGTTDISWLSQGQGTISISGKNFGYADSSGGNVFSLSDGSQDNKIYFTHYWQTQLKMNHAGVQQFLTYRTIPAYGESFALAFYYSDNDVLAFYNGDEHFKANSGITIPTNFDRLNIGSDPFQNYNGSVALKSFRYWSGKQSARDLRKLSVTE